VKLLLDTPCWLWWFAEPERLNQSAVAQIADESNELWLSAASVWEMGIKVAIGKLRLPESLETYVASRMRQLDTRPLEIKAPHAMRAAALPMHHRDPVDRMLVAQAQLEGMALVSADEVFRKYNEPVLVWAGR
jgi:PIN domain nuclease of toxin-antitoxin system